MGEWHRLGGALAVEGRIIMTVVMMQDGRQWYSPPNGVRSIDPTGVTVTEKADAIYRIPGHYGEVESNLAQLFTL